MKKKHSDYTKEKILNGALDLWPDVTLLKLSEHIGITHSNILYHYPDGTLKDATAEHAVKIGRSEVIVQLIATGHPAVEDMSPCEKTKHFNQISTSRRTV